MSWYDPGKPVISPGKQIESKYPGMEVPVLPARAVVFCLGKGMPVLKEHFPCRQLMEKLPGFITHSEVLGIDGIPGCHICSRKARYCSLLYARHRKAKTTLLCPLISCQPT